MNQAKILYVAALFLGINCGNVKAEDPSTISLHYGNNLVNLGSAEETGMVMLARRENFNAHGFDVLTLYLKPTQTNSDAEDWQLVSIFDDEKEALTLTAGGGADCTIHDFRLVREDAKGSARLIVAEREFGSTYADIAPVRFKFYTLRRNGSAEVGRPRYYFELINKNMSKKPYCDVGKAFVNELGIGSYHK